MVDVETGLFTVGVFKDVASAQKGLDALKRAGFPVESLTIVAKETPEAGALMTQTLGATGDRIDLAPLGPSLGRGPLLPVLQGATQDLATLGLARTMRKVGFQTHDGRIFEVLTGRGGVLVAIRSDPRAADALAILHSYGGGNAAIGAWSGKV